MSKSSVLTTLYSKIPVFIGITDIFLLGGGGLAERIGNYCPMLSLVPPLLGVISHLKQHYNRVKYTYRSKS